MIRQQTEGDPLFGLGVDASDGVAYRSGIWCAFTGSGFKGSGLISLAAVECSPSERLFSGVTLGMLK